MIDAGVSILLIACRVHPTFHVLSVFTPAQKLGMCVVVCALFSAILPGFRTVGNLLAWARNISVLGVFSPGMAIVVIARTGFVAGRFHGLRHGGCHPAHERRLWSTQTPVTTIFCVQVQPWQAARASGIVAA